MQQLITIETIPISIKYVEKKPIEAPESLSAQLHIARQNNTMTIKSDPVRIKTDAFIQSDPIDSWHLTYTATAKYSDDGSLRLNVQMADIDASTFVFQQFGRGVTNTMDFLPQTNESSLNGFESVQINFDISQLPSALPAVDNIDTSFLPPDFEIEVVERPKVIIKYVGGPLYIPKSSDPDYIPPENLDKKA